MVNFSYSLLVHTIPDQCHTSSMLFPTLLPVTVAPVMSSLLINTLYSSGIQESFHSCTGVLRCANWNKYEDFIEEYLGQK